jgi:hypothetical protein
MVFMFILVLGGEPDKCCGLVAPPPPPPHPLTPLHAPPAPLTVRSRSLAVVMPTEACW